MSKGKVFSGHQPNFLPYMGFFYKMFKSDIFVLDDDVQYSSKGLHNSNFIKVNNQKHKITIPVSYDFGAKINEVKISYEKPWVQKFLSTVIMNYGKARFFDEGYDFLEKENNLCKFNTDMIKEISERFGIECEIYISSEDVPTELTNNERNVFQCEHFGCNTYYSGIGGKEYNDEEMYNEKCIKIVYTDYEPVKYKQRGNEFIENLSVIDYIFNNGFILPESWHKDE